MRPVITMEGRLTRDPELRFLPNGTAVSNFTIAANDRKKNETSGEWEDVGETLFVKVTVWRNLAETVSESILQGDLVVVVGKLGVTKWNTKEGEPRTDITLDGYTVAKVITAGRKMGKSSGSSAPDPWSSAPASSNDDVPPF